VAHVAKVQARCRAQSALAAGPNSCPEQKSRRFARRAAAIMFATGPVIALLSGCDTLPTSAAPPTVVCGTTLSKSAAGPFLQDVSRGGRVKFATIGGELFLQVSDDCDHGAIVTWRPHAAATELLNARAADGRKAAVVLRPNIKMFTITVSKPDGPTLQVTVDLPADRSPEPTAG
jgi:hypothetical protein